MPIRRETVIEMKRAERDKLRNGALEQMLKPKAKPKAETPPKLFEQADPERKRLGEESA